LAELQEGYGSQIGTKSFQATAARALFASNTAFAPVKNPKTQEEADRSVNAMIETATRMVNNGTMNAADATAMIKSNRSRPDMNGMSFGALMGQVDRSVKRSNKDKTAGFENYDGPLINHDEVFALKDTVANGTAPGALVGQRHEAVTAMAPHMLERLQRMQDSGDEKGFQRELAAIAGRYDAMAQIAPQNAAIMADQVLGKTIKGRDGQPVFVQQMIEQVRSGVGPDGKQFNTQEFDNMRRDFKQQGIRDSEAQRQMEALRGQDPTAGPNTGFPGQH
jgi:hypothetical protein